MKISLPCPVCSGTGFDTCEDRHAGTIKDTCRRCGGEGEIVGRIATTPDLAPSPGSGSFGYARIRQVVRP